MGEPDIIDFLADDDTPQGEEARQRFVIDTEEKAEWALLKLRKIRAEQERRYAIAQAEQERITQWLNLQLTRWQADESFFLGALEGYHRRVLEQDPKAKSISLPAGKLKSIQGQPRVEVSDMGAFVDWARAYERFDLMRVSYEPVKAAIKSLPVNEGVPVTEDGEIVPGVEVIEGQRSFKVEL